MCMNFAALGTGWDLAEIGDRDEFNVIDQLHRAAFTLQSYFIGGTTETDLCGKFANLGGQIMVICEQFLM